MIVYFLIKFILIQLFLILKVSPVKQKYVGVVVPKVEPLTNIFFQINIKSFKQRFCGSLIK